MPAASHVYSPDGISWVRPPRGRSSVVAIFYKPLIPTGSNTIDNLDVLAKLFYALVGVLANKILLAPGHTVMRLLSVWPPTAAGIYILFIKLSQPHSGGNLYRK